LLQIFVPQNAMAPNLNCEGSTCTSTCSRSARHNLLSIYDDSNTFLRRVIEFFHERAALASTSASAPTLKLNHHPQSQISLSWPIVSNKRCGEWYGFPYANAAHETTFKSTDGHTGTYNFSLKRLNLAFLSTACASACSCSCAYASPAVFIIDASKTKIQPDSFSKTLPIWCAVLNRLVLAFEKEQEENEEHGGVNITAGEKKKKRTRRRTEEEWDTNLYTPPCVSDEERECIMKILPRRVQSVIDSGVIVDKEWFLNTLKKPLRCFWISNNHTNKNNEVEEGCWDDLYTTIQQAQTKYTCIICVSVSESGGALQNIPQYRARPSGTAAGREKQEQKENDEEWYYYTPGAADDHEFGTWSQGLTPRLFWKNVETILFQKKKMTIEDTQGAIRRIMKQRKDRPNDDDDDDDDEDQLFDNFFDTVGALSGISIGSRKAGRPPLCWEHFDAILNVTEMEYDALSSREKIEKGKYYLQLKVKEGKKDRTELEKWMAVAVTFIGVHIAAKRRILVHCAQGRDRSVAVVLAAICIFCRLSDNRDNNSNSEDSVKSNGSRRDLVYHPWVTRISLQSLTEFVSQRRLVEINEENEGEYYSSGIPSFLIHQLLGRPGKDMLFHYLRSISSSQNESNGRLTVNSNSNEDSGDEKLFATKESLRIALMIIQQYRDKACPSRKTMQKLNRFFMSNLNE